MTKLRIANLFLIVSSIFVSLAAFGPARNTYAQESSPQVSQEAARGLSLYKSGDVRGAVNVLRERVKVKAGDADAWHYLGLIAMKGGDLKSAIQSFQTAVKLRPNFIPSRTSDPERRAAYEPFWDVFQRALDGAASTPERIRQLYPTLKEIVDEQDEIPRAEAEFERRSAGARRGWQKRREHSLGVN